MVTLRGVTPERDIDEMAMASAILYSYMMMMMMPRMPMMLHISAAGVTRC